MATQILEVPFVPAAHPVAPASSPAPHPVAPVARPVPQVSSTIRPDDRFAAAAIIFGTMLAFYVVSALLLVGQLAQV